MSALTPGSAPGSKSLPQLGWPASGPVPALPPGSKVHFVGIGGTGMSALAEVMAARGLEVSGSDRAAGPFAMRLQARGIRVVAGHRADAVTSDTALVVRSPAVPADNVEILAAGSLGIPVAKRAVLVGGLLDAMRGVSIAGTHGKTTTAGLVAWICVQAGLDPVVLVGGDVPDIGGNARNGGGAVLVVEADEYDRTFLHGRSWLSVVLCVEHDHPDIYPDLDAVRDAFRAFVRLVRDDGKLILGAGSAGAGYLEDAATVPVELFSLAEDPLPDATVARWQLADRQQRDEEQHFAVARDGEPLGTFSCRLPGRHNAANCLAAIATAAALDIPVDLIRSAVASYRGVARRFQVVSTVAGITIVDDYAHHPSAVAATIRAARERYTGRRLCAVLEPHTYSRVAALADDFTRALRSADAVVVTPVYGAREDPVAGAGASRIAAGLEGAVATETLDQAVEICADRAVSGDVVLFLGAGEATRASRLCARRIAGRCLRDVVHEAARLGVGGTATADASLDAYTTLRVGGPALAVVEADDPGALVGWWRLAWQHDLPVFVLGRGSNVLVADEGLLGLVIVNRCDGWSLSEAGGHGTVVVESGAWLSSVARRLARLGWSGIEAGAGIPGSVGAAVVGNAGAHGWCMADSVERVETVPAGGEAEEWTADQLAFQYRSSRLRRDRGRLVTRVWLRVERRDPEEICRRIGADLERRRSTQPAAASAGSIFKNPPGDHAGRLIEAAGLKGATAGGAQISPVHANFIVNAGGATADDVLQLIDRARRGVRDRFGVQLELEIEILGNGHAD